MIAILMFIVKLYLHLFIFSFLVGSTKAKRFLIGILICLLFDFVLMFVFYLTLKHRLFGGGCFCSVCSVQHSGNLFHATPTYYRYLSNNEIAGSYLSSPAHTALNHSARSFACLI